MNRYLIGLDVGTINDWTAVSVLQKYGEWEPVPVRKGLGTTLEDRWCFREYRLLHLERHLGEPYTEIVRHVQALTAQPRLEGARIVVDGTGVGRPVIDVMADLGLKRLTPVIITGGDNVSSSSVHGRMEYRVPKRDLVGTLQVLLQNQELRIPANLPLRQELTTELQNFKIKLNAETGHDSYEHWRSSDHDDLVLSVALPLWYAEKKAAPPVRGANLPI